MKVAIFSLAGKDYAVDITRVRGVVRMRQIVPVPEAARCVAGVMGLRGRVVPVVDLRILLGLPARGAGLRQRILLSLVRNRPTGLIVDDVTEVLDIAGADVSEPDEMLREADYLTGVARLGARLILLVDMDRLLAGAHAGMDEMHRKVELRRKKDG